MASEPILITGAAGFVGSTLARALLDRGDRVIGIDNLNDYYPIVHKRRNLARLNSDKQFTFIESDIRDADAMRELFQQHRPQAVAHLAAMAAVRYSVQHPLIYGQVNVQGTMNLLDAARQAGNPRMVLASTGSAYGANTPVPFVETAAADRPLAPYPASKRAMELMAHSYHHLFKLQTTILRFFNVYGPFGRPDMMPWQWSRMILRGETLTLYNSGRLKRDWTYVDDIVAGFIAALDRPFDYEIINLGCSRPVENIEFVRTLETILGRQAAIVDAPCPPSEPMVTYADITKARQMLGYEPKVNVAEGLERFIKWATEQKVFES
ncbi:MAG TPA: NAD-dependent epimerase/dehydratase family protein [Tepidisphaeraceae bacterium]|nr:NAD-dependent epimerase/dehydratase family protein [Tepidisphaeraceae bacterium]